MCTMTKALWAYYLLNTLCLDTISPFTDEEMGEQKTEATYPESYRKSVELVSKPGLIWFQNCLREEE